MTTSAKNDKLHQPVMRLTLSGIMIAMATVLSLFTIFKMPQGGAITPLSMLPIIIIGYLYGVRWGCFTGMVYGILQIFTGATFAGNTFWVTVGSIVLDYLLAFACLGFGGLFAKLIKSQTVSITLGALVACIGRFICHFISGALLFGAYAPEGQTIFYYSLTYNAVYMLPELITTVIGAALLGGIFDFARLARKSK